MAKNKVKGSPKTRAKETNKGRKLGHTRAVQKREKWMVKRILTGRDEEEVKETKQSDQ